MSFVAISDNGFPPLNKANQSIKVKGKHKLNGRNKDEFLEDKKHKSQSPKSPTALRVNDEQVNIIANGNDFVRSRVGYRLSDYKEDLAAVIKKFHIGHHGDFILTPIAPIRAQIFDCQFECIPDLVLPAEEWQTKVAVDIGYPSLDHYSAQVAQYYEKLFRHALYLSTPVINITCPDSDLAFLSLASLINRRLRNIRTFPLVLFKISMSKNLKETPSSWVFDSTFAGQSDLSDSVISSSQEHDCDTESRKKANNSVESSKEDSISYWDSESSARKQPYQFNRLTNKSMYCPWKQWNAIRSHLEPDPRIGVCLEINDELPDDEEEWSKWAGEPVRMLIIHTDAFIKSPGHNGYLRLNVRCKEFIKRIVLHNSLRCSLVLECATEQDPREYLIHLDELSASIKQLNPDPLRDWNDKIQPPLQPLSSNLDSGTYGVFEMDSTKYIKYSESMVEALSFLIKKEESVARDFIIMVLGAGRGPLVDSFIDAIRSLRPSVISQDSNFKFKIFALDKNPSSVRSMKYKQKKQWQDPEGAFETEVVESDMRLWEPNVKADIIATELLGSFSDNELSPECIDGVWKFSTPQTISIPQQYASHIAPICSFKMHQELYKLKGLDTNPYDQIYVVRLTNCYYIDEPKQLFKFEHKDLSLAPSERCNERYMRLMFWSKVDTVCHGFVGYFTADLFGTVSISTRSDQKTPNMDSWFPVFIPLEQPVQLPRGTKLDVHFWRKESSSSVWYEWAVTHPDRSRIHSLNGVSSAMSKFI